MLIKTGYLGCEQSLFYPKILGEERKEERNTSERWVGVSERDMGSREPLLSDHGSPLDPRMSRWHAHLFCVLPLGFLSKRETARSLPGIQTFFTVVIFFVLT